MKLAGGGDKKTQKVCPVCKSSMITSRYNKNFQECKKCGVIKNTAFFSVKYEDTYFTEEYRDQYGKTYEEDYDSIYSFSVKRVNRINSIVKKRKLHVNSICDIGCALGFFLKACEDGLLFNQEPEIEGIEISACAAEYCTNKFGYKILNENFLSSTVNKKYDLITAWYCIEHFENPVLVIQKISKLLRDGGIIAVSLPSPFGPEKTCNPKTWFNNHPVDHSYDYSPKAIRLLLRQNGFEHIQVYPSSVHPERILHTGNFFYSLFSSVYSLFSHITGFSDTIEVYAVKR